MFVNWICLCFSLFLWSRILTLIVVNSSLKIEEFFHKMAISLKSGQVKQNNRSSLANWTNWTLSAYYLLWLLENLSYHLCIPVSLPPLYSAIRSAFGLPRKLLDSSTLSLSLSVHPHILPHYACCISACCWPKHNFRRRSLSMLVPRKEWPVP